MERLRDFQGKAPKIGGQGHVHYEIWHDENGVLYVRMNANEINTVTPGTFSGLLYSVSKYMNIRNSYEELSGLEGFDLEQRCIRQNKDNNDGGFLKAVLRHLLPTTNN